MPWNLDNQKKDCGDKVDESMLSPRGMSTINFLGAEIPGTASIYLLEPLFLPPPDEPEELEPVLEPYPAEELLPLGKV